MKATSGRPWETFTSSQTSSWCGRRLALHVAIIALLVPAVIFLALEVEHSRRITADCSVLVPQRRQLDHLIEALQLAVIAVNWCVAQIVAV